MEAALATTELALDERNRREEDRLPVRYDTEYRSAGTSYSTTVLNLSRWGLMATCEAEPTVRSYVYVVLPGVGSLPARVQWVEDGRFGVNLLEPILEHHFERLVKVLPARN